MRATKHGATSIRWFDPSSVTASTFALARIKQWVGLHSRPSPAGSLNGRVCQAATLPLDRLPAEILGAGCEEKNWQNLQ
jgi:hypothetical protein